MNKKYTFAILAFAATAAHAQSDASQETPPYTVTGNVAVTSDYMFRGLTQTWGGPAVQGGFDLTLANGFAAGTWASSVSDKTYPGAALELDLYASYGTQINDDWSWRAGLYGYVYPHGNLDDAGLRSRSFNTLEANAALTYKWLTLKYSHALTDYFGIDTEQGYRDDSKGTGYLEFNATIPFKLHEACIGTSGVTTTASGVPVPAAICSGVRCQSTGRTPSVT